MSEFLIKMLLAVYGGVGMNAVEQVNTSFENYSATAYRVATEINSYAVKPIAGLLLTLMLLLEFARITTKVEGDQKLGAQMVGVALFKGAFIIVLIQNTQLIIQAINSLGMELIVKAGNNNGGGQGTQVAEELLRKKVEEMGTLEQVGMLPILFIPWIISLAASIVIPIVVIYRFLEIYVLTAGASLPLVFIANPETKNIGISYLRKLAAAILHGFTLVVAVKIFAGFQKDSVKSMPNISQLVEKFDIASFTTNIGSLILSQILLIVVVLGAGKLAKALVGE